MVIAGLLLLAAAAAPGHALAQTQQDAGVSLKVGAKKSLAVENISRVAVGDPSVADISVGAKDVVEVTGRSAGTTQLHVWKSDGQKLSYAVTVTR